MNANADGDTPVAGGGARVPVRRDPGGIPGTPLRQRNGARAERTPGPGVTCSRSRGCRAASS